ncbi:MAG: phage portal protein [Victivallales bacterium]|nr:phage portal protein [Victivallales bacterium]
MKVEKPSESALMPNIIDKVAARISPKWAYNRYVDRVKMSMAGGGYASAKKTGAVFDNYITSVTDADSSVNWGERLTIVERVRQLVRDSPVARALINRICDHSVGARGLTLHPQIDSKLLGWDDQRAAAWQDEADSLWRAWSESAESDLSRIQNFQQKTLLTLQSFLEGGDCFTLFTDKERKGSDYRLKLQTLESERVSNKDYGQDTAKLTEGIEKDSDGAPSKIWISNKPPGDYSNTITEVSWIERRIFGEKTGRRNILQHFNQIRPGQTRGIPVLGTVVDKLIQLGRLSNAELLAAVINSFYTIIITGDPSSTQEEKTAPTDPSAPSANDKLTLGHGSIVRGDAGTNFESFDPNRPNHLFEPYFKAMVAEIGAAVGVPRSLILLSFDKSYSASRGEIMEAWLYFLAKRTDMAIGLCQPTYEAFLDEVIYRGMLDAPGYFLDDRIKKAFQGSGYNQWTGPTRPAFNELQEAKANELNNKMGVKSLTAITSETQGKDFLRVNDQIKRENELRAEKGIEEIIDPDELEEVA